MKIDLHTHTEYSHDSRLPIERIIEIAKRKGLDGIAITDHNTFKGVERAIEMNLDDFLIIRGEEITSDRGDILGLFIEEKIESRRYLEVINEIKDKGGLVILPHPFDIHRGEHFKNVEEIKDNIDGVEVYNSRYIYNKANEEAVEFARKNDLIKTGGSDTHTIFGVGNCYVETEASDLEEFRKKLEDKDVKVRGKRSNPLVHLISIFNKKFTK
ncbi:MAG: PHP domain-containing protein [Candidatus Aenigmatarchaeota archaeon]